MPVYCIDLDGTLCSNDAEHSKAIPYRERIAKINKLYEEGNTIIIDTARGSETGEDWMDFTEKQLKKWNVKYNRLRVGIKVFANFYIDDKAIKDSDFFND